MLKGLILRMLHSTRALSASRFPLSLPAFLLLLLPIHVHAESATTLASNLLENEVTASESPSELPPDTGINPSSVNGWQFLAQELISIGAPRERVLSILGDKRMPQRTPVPFKLRPRETEQMYVQFTQPARLAVARGCLETHGPIFESAEGSFNVSRYVLAALILIETQCGRFTGNNSVLERLARVSSVAEPKNIDFNFSQLTQTDSSVTREAVAARARYLQETFLPEVKALLSVAEVKGIDVFDLRGSVAGAFGLPQFLPTSYLRYGVDGNSDGKVDLFDPQDAIPSTANYLRSFGWDESAPVHDKKKVLWNYNRSDAYGDAVLKVSILLRESARSSERKKGS